MMPGLMCGYKADVTPTPGGSSQVADPNAPILKGDDPRMTQKRKKLFAILAKMLPQAFDVAGTPARHKQGNYKPMTCGYKGATGTSCTAFNPAVMGIACAGARARIRTGAEWGFDAQQHPGWVDYAPGKSPSVGDTYLLYDEGDEPDAARRHRPPRSTCPPGPDGG